MRRIGGHISTSGGLINAIANTEKIGGNCMQIFAGSPRLWSRSLYPDRVASDFKSAVEEKDLSPVFIHALYLINLATDKQELLSKSINSLVMDLSNGAIICASAVIVHIGSHQGRGFESAKTQIVSAIKQILDQVDGCDLALEVDAGQNGKVGSLEEIAELINLVDSPRVKICLDTAHLFASGIDLRKAEAVEEMISFFESRNLSDRLVCIHLNDSASDLDSHRDLHANLGVGQIGINALSYLVNHQKLIHLPLILEVPGTDKMGPNLENITIAKSL